MKKEMDILVQCSNNKQHKIVMEVKIQQKSSLQVIFDINTFHC